MEQKFYFFIKRIFDIFASAAALIVLSPAWLIVIIGIELSDPGPVFYMAKRVGKDNKPFRMFKFRSMRVDDSANEVNFKADKDRIFPFGQFIRDTKLDEIPQLINVLIGNMTVIGPRPASADQANVTRAGAYEAVSKVKPGLSCPSALYDYIYGDTIDNEEDYRRLVLKTRLNLDLYYCENMSAGFDLKMIWDTVVCIFELVCHKMPQRIYDELVAMAQTVDVGELVINEDNLSYRR